MQKNGKVATDRLIAQSQHFFRRRADDYPVALDDGATEKLVSDRATDKINFHQRILTAAGDGRAIVNR